MLAETRSRIRRYTPDEVRADPDLLVVDLRSHDERERTGVIPGSKPVALSVLPWRADQTSEWRDEEVAGRVAADQISRIDAELDEAWLAAQ